jgi:hypothetical protein
MAKRAANRRAAQRRVDVTPATGVWWRRPWVITTGALAAAGLVLGGVVLAVRVLSPAPLPTAIPAPIIELAPVDTAATGPPVDGLLCQHTQQTRFRYHTHLAVFVDGQARSIPAGIGIAPPRSQTAAPEPYINGGSCIYWLHTHTGDGIIYIESPTVRSYTMGKFFDIWRQPLSTTQVGPARGKVVAYVDGQRFTGDPSTIPLGSRTVVQLDVGIDVPPQPYTFAAGL